MHNLAIEQTPISALRPRAYNARTHSKRQIRQIADSIKRFGFCNAILVDDDLTILAGHGRVAAAQLLKLEFVPTVRLSHLSEADKRAYVIADNRLAEKSGWDRNLLALELQELIDIGFEVELTGFETPEIDLLLDEGLEASGLTPSATVMAAEKTGREAYALEIDPAYTDVIVQRWQSYTGKPALLAASGLTFEELAEQRNPACAPSDAGDQP